MAKLVIRLTYYHDEDTYDDRLELQRMIRWEDAVADREEPRYHLDTMLEQLEAAVKVREK
jgi:hypothetical protein